MKFNLYCPKCDFKINFYKDEPYDDNFLIKKIYKLGNDNIFTHNHEIEEKFQFDEETD